MKEVNKSVPKLDGEGLTEGRPAYTDDYSPANSLIIKVLRSPHPFAKILNIDTGRAEKLSGVECVLTYKNVPRNNFTRAGQGYPEPSPHDKFILDEYVRYVGDEVAAVAAKDEETALQAIRLIEVDYQILDPVLNFEETEGNRSIIHAENEAHEMFPTGYDPKRNIAGGFNMELGDVDNELKKCPYVVRERYYTQPQCHTAMEPHSSFAYIDITGRLIVVSSTQTPFHVRRIIAMTLGLPLEKVRVIKPRIGGGYGGKQALHGEMFVSLVTLRTGKPSKLIYNREETFEATYSRHAMRIDVSMGCDSLGNIKAIDMYVLSDTGAYGEHALTVFMGAGSKALPLYNKAEAVRFGGKVVYTNHSPAGAFRGYGAVQGNFAVESAADILAQKIGWDPVEFRKHNMIKEGESSPVFRKMGEGAEGVDMVMESCKLDYCMERGAELSHWSEKYGKGKRNVNSASEDSFQNGKAHGIGCAIAMQGSGIPLVDMASAILKLNDSGFFNLYAGATDIGTGSDTILSQIAAETLGVPTEKIIVYSSDTDLSPFDTGAYASSTTYVTGNAVRDAASKMKALIEKAGAEKFGVNPADVIFDGEKISNRYSNCSISLYDLSNELFYNKNQKQLVTCGSFVGKVSPPPFSASFAEVEVDTETGKVDVINYTSVVDCGTAVNPNLARVQVEGGIAQGIGLALFEKPVYSGSGKLLTNSFLNYKIPSRKDINKITVEFAESYEPTGPYGAKSVGEVSIDAVPAAIANAIYNAIGIRFNKLPVMPEDVLTAIKQKREKEK